MLELSGQLREMIVACRVKLMASASDVISLGTRQIFIRWDLTVERDEAYFRASGASNSVPAQPVPTPSPLASVQPV